MNFHNSNVVKTSKIKTSAMKQKKKHRVIVRTTPMSSKVGKFAMEGRNLSLSRDGTRFSTAADGAGAADDLRSRNDQTKCLSRDSRISKPTMTIDAVANQLPKIGGID